MIYRDQTQDLNTILEYISLQPGGIIKIQNLLFKFTDHWGTSTSSYPGDLIKKLVSDGFVEEVFPPEEAIEGAITYSVTTNGFLKLKEGGYRHPEGWLKKDNYSNFKWIVGIFLSAILAFILGLLAHKLLK